jgi:hypothetical protein
MTLEERCRLSEECLPDAPYRQMLTQLHEEMLTNLAESHHSLQDMVQKSFEMVQKSRDLICEIESVREEINSLKLLVEHG